ncbi:MAG TPA: hypothetical protein DDW71_00640 [Lactobacillus sp.]|nr:hypothetical protein [Lactobacillus sp.]
MQLKLTSPMIYMAPKRQKKRPSTRQSKFTSDLLAQINIFQFNSTPSGDLLQTIGGHQHD